MRHGKTVAQRLAEAGIANADADEAVHDLLDELLRFRAAIDAALDELPIEAAGAAKILWATRRHTGGSGS